MRRDIEGLRAISIIAVVIYHFLPEILPGGYIGVDVFFVISGYLVTQSLLQLSTRNDSLLRIIRHFYARRARRLLPHALLVIVVCILTGLTFFSDFALKRMGSDVFWTAIYSINWLYVLRAVDYLQWDDAKQGALLHFWSLAVEEQFYLFWPVALCFALGGRKSQPEEHPRGTALRWTLGLATLSLAYCVWLSRNHLTMAFFSSPARAWELLAGALVALEQPRAGSLPARYQQAGRLLASAVLLACLVGFNDETRHPGWLTAIPVAACCVLVRPGVGTPESAAARWLTWSPLPEIGQRSYAIYLWHWPALTFGKVLWPQGGSLVGLLALAATFVLAEAGYRWVERPARFKWWLAATPGQLLIAAVLLSATTAGVGFGLRALASTGGRELLTLHSSQHVRAARLPTPQQVAADLPSIYANGCHLALEAVAPKDGCTAGHVDGVRLTVLFGDSHAAQWFPALDEIARQRGERLLAMTKSSCPSADVGVWNGVARSAYTQCETWRKEVMARLRTVGAARVVLSNLIEEPIVVVDRDTGRLLKGREAAAAWRQGLERTIQQLRALGLEVVVVRDTPRPRPDVQDCLYAAADAAKCELTRAEALSAPALDVAAARASGAEVWDFSDQICPAGRCPVLVPGEQPEVVYRDSNHLTATYVRRLVPEMQRRWGATGTGRATASGS